MRRVRWLEATLWPGASADARVLPLWHASLYALTTSTCHVFRGQTAGRGVVADFIAKAGDVLR